MEVKKLDAFINELSYNMVKEINNDRQVLRFIDKALGVLVNDGVYAYYVYCKAQKKERIEDIFIRMVVEKINEVSELKNYFLTNNIQENGYEEFFRNLSLDLHKLLFFRDILEQTLIYARYHAKPILGEQNE
jgi:hypothetical protein